MFKHLLIPILVFVLSANFVFAEVPTTTGFIPGSIWYSHEPLVEGDTVKIYTAVWNADDKPLSAKVEFYDKNVVLGTRDVVVDKSSLKDVSISWKVTSGDHTISAKIISSNTTTGGKSEKVVLERTSTKSDKIFVPVSVKNAKDEDTSNTKVVKDQIAIPESLTTSIADTFSPVESMRLRIDQDVDTSKEKTKQEIDQLEGQGSITKEGVNTGQKPLDATERPIAYIKLFLLSIVGFVFGSKLVFYGLSLLILFLVLRFIYRKIRHRR